MANGQQIRRNAHSQFGWFGIDGLANPHNEATTGRPTFTPLGEEGRIREEIVPKTLFPGVRHGGPHFTELAAACDRSQSIT